MNHVCQLLLKIVSYSYTKTVVFIGVHLFTEVNICAVSQPYGPSSTEQSFSREIQAQQAVNLGIVAFKIKMCSAAKQEAIRKLKLILKKNLIGLPEMTETFQNSESNGFDGEYASILHAC